MNQQYAEFGNLKKKWRCLYWVDPRRIETTYLPDAVQQIGAYTLLKVINARLHNSRFEVKFEFGNVRSTLMNEVFAGLALFHHELTVPKATAFLNQEVIQSVFDVIDVREEKSTRTYMVYLHEGPFANTIAEIVGNINVELGPRVEAMAKQLGLTEYQLTFNISFMY